MQSCFEQSLIQPFQMNGGEAACPGRKNTEHLQSSRKQIELPSSKDTEASVCGDAAT